MSVERRLGELERRIRERSPGDGAAREYLSGLLDRYAAARQQGAVTEVLEAEFRSARGALGARAVEPRGEGYR